MAPILETALNIKRPGFWGLDQFLGSSAKSANSLLWLRFASYPALIRGGLCDYPGKMGNNWADSAPNWGRKNATSRPYTPLSDTMQAANTPLAFSSLVRKSFLLGCKHSRLLSVSLLLFGVACFIAYIARLNGVTHDLYHAMALARHTFDTGVFPQNDVFAFTPTMEPTVHHEWGFGLIAYLTTANPWGAALLMSLKFLLIATMLLCSYRVHRERGGDPIFFGLGMLLVLPFFWVGFATIRAQLFTLTAISIQMVMLEADWKGRRAWIIGWLVLLLVWLNVHAGFVIGAGMMAFHGLERIIAIAYRERSCLAVWKGTWHLFVAVPFAVGALWLNPYGTDYIVYLAYGLTMARPLIAEWGPLWTTYEPLQTMLAYSVSVALLFYVVRYRQWTRLRGFIFVSLCALMALKHIRHGSIYGIIWLAYVPAWLSFTPMASRLRSLLVRKQKVVSQFALAIATICVGFALWHPLWRPYLPVTVSKEQGNYPLGAVDYLAANQFQGKLVTDFDAGAYVTWKLFPRVLVSLDGRYEAAFKPGVLEEHIELYKAQENWGKWLDKWQAQGLVVPSGSQLGQHLETLVPMDSNPENVAAKTEIVAHTFPGSQRRWKCVYRDPGTMVWMEESVSLPRVIQPELPEDITYGQ